MQFAIDGVISNVMKMRAKTIAMLDEVE